jgi:hypothetical protein
MYSFGKQLSNGECESYGKYWWRKCNLRRTEYYAHCERRRYLCLEYGCDYSCHHSESDYEHNLYGNGNQQQWMYGYRFCDSKH